MPQESALEVVFLVVGWASLVGLSYAVVRLDERRLEPEDAERAWTPASRDNAIVGLGLLGSPLLSLVAVLVHFVRTRARLRWPPLGLLRGLALGVAAVVAVFAAYALLVTGLALVLGVEAE